MLAILNNSLFSNIYCKKNVVRKSAFVIPASYGPIFVIKLPHFILPNSMQTLLIGIETHNHCQTDSSKEWLFRFWGLEISIERFRPFSASNHGTPNNRSLTNPIKYHTVPDTCGLKINLWGGVHHVPRMGSKRRY